MQIFAAAADPHSWLKLMGQSPTDANNYATNFSGNSLKWGTKFPKITIPVSGNDIFLKFRISGYCWAWEGIQTYFFRAPPHKFISFKNAAGKIVFSVGWLPYNSVYTNDYPNITQVDFGIFKWDDTNSTPVSFTSFNKPLTSLGEVTRDCFLSIAFHLDSIIESNSNVKVNGSNSIDTTINDATNISAVTDKVVTNVVIGDGITASGTTTYWYVNIASMICSDTVDHSLKAVSLKPSSFGTINDFTGSISNVTSALQDKLYLSSAAEIGSTVEINLSDLPAIYTDTSTIVHKLDQYFMGRYIQLGGVSVTFELQLFNDTIAVTDPIDVVIPANENEDQYLTRYISSYLTNLNTTALFKVSELNALKLKVSLKGV